MGSASSSAADTEYQEGKNTDMNGKQPKPGDLIEIFRIGFQHWAVYIGGGNVVHFVVNGMCSSGSRVPVPRGKGVVLKEKLEEVVGGDRWRINNSLDEKYKPRPMDDIMKQAVGLIGTRLPYNLLKYNCEHFATNLRYGNPECRQVIKVGEAIGVGGALAGLVGIIGFMASSLFELIRR